MHFPNCNITLFTYLIKKNIDSQILVRNCDFKIFFYKNEYCHLVITQITCTYYHATCTEIKWSHFDHFKLFSLQNVLVDGASQFCNKVKWRHPCILEKSWFLNYGKAYENINLLCPYQVLFTIILRITCNYKSKSMQ